MRIEVYIPKHPQGDCPVDFLRETMFYLYKITNLILNKSYIGVTKNPSRRFLDHKHGRGSKKLLEDGIDNLEFKVLVAGNERYIFDLESQAINIYNTIYPTGYNVGVGGEGGNISDRKGELNSCSKLSEEDVIKIRKLIASDKTITHQQLADFYNISREAISYIARGASWAHIGGPITKRKCCSEEDIKQMKDLYKAGTTRKKIASELGWAYTTVYKYTK